MLQTLRQTSSGTILTAVSATVSVGGISDVWQITTSDLYVDDVFNTYLYTGNGATQTITNGIDLAGSGGMVWLKSRNVGNSNSLFDTIRTKNNLLQTDLANAQVYSGLADTLTSFNDNGFSLGGDTWTHTANWNATTQVSWTFRKAPKFFDVVTYTGDGTANRQIAHSLGIEPGMINTKSTSTTGDWNTYHRSATGDLKLNTTDAQTGSKTILPTASTTTFTVSGVANTNGVTYVAYLYAHDESANGLIQCGINVANTTVNLGWEPQFILYKPNWNIAGWRIFDTGRGFSLSGAKKVYANTSVTETDGTSVDNTNTIFPNAKGFDIVSDGFNSNIYCAIRRPNKPPVSSASVYKAIARTGTGAAATVTGVGFAPDLVFNSVRNVASRWHFTIDKSRGVEKYLATNMTDVEYGSGTFANGLLSFNQDGVSLGVDTAGATVNANGDNEIMHFFRRAPGFFDIVAYTGNGVARTVPHNLGVVPEMMIVKSRSYAQPWAVYAAAIGNTKNVSTLNSMAV